MDQAAQVAQAALAETGIDHVDRRPLLADEQHPLAAGHVVGDQVGDRLRFPGAGRALDDVAGAGPGLFDGRGLRGVGGHDVIALVQRQGGRQLAFGRPGRQGEGGLEGRVPRRLVQQRLIVPHQRHLAVLEVPQRHAAQVEVPDVGVFLAPFLQVKEQTFLFGRGRIGPSLRERFRLRSIPLSLRESAGVRGDRLKTALTPCPSPGRRGELFGSRPRFGGGEAPRPRFLFDDRAEMRGGRTDLRREQRDAQRMVVGLIVAVVQVLETADAAAGQPGPAAILVQLAACPVVDQLDPRPVDLVEGNGRLAGRDLPSQVVEKLVQAGRRQVEHLGQVDVVKLLELVADDRVDLGLRGNRFQRIGVADAFFLLQLHGQEDQRGIEPLDRLLLEVRPVEEADHQPQLPEAEFGLVPPRLGHDAIEHAGQIQGLGEVQVLVQGDRPAADHGGVQTIVPDEDLFRPDAGDVERQGDRGVREVDGLHRGAEVQQPVPLGNLEQPLAEFAQHHVLLGAVVLLDESGDAGQVHLEIDLLVAVVLQIVQQGPKVLDAAMAVDLRHAGNRLGQDGVQPRVQREQVAAMGDEALQVLGVGKVQAAGQAGQNHSQAEDVGQGIVMAELLLPGDVAGKVDGPGEGGRAVADREIGQFAAVLRRLPSCGGPRRRRSRPAAPVASTPRRAAVLLRGACRRASSNQIRTPSTRKASSPSSGATPPAAWASRTSRTSGKKLPRASSVEKPPVSSRARRYS